MITDSVTFHSYRHYAAIWGRDHEQRSLFIGLLGPRLCEGTDMGLHSRGAGYSHSLHRDGSLCQLPDHLPSVDIFHCLHPLSILTSTGVRPRLRGRMVVEPLSEGWSN